MSLRIRLALGLIVIGVVLVAADVALVASVRSSLVGQVDNRLRSAAPILARRAERDLVGPGGTTAFDTERGTTTQSEVGSPSGQDPGSRPVGNLSELFIQVRAEDGQVVSEIAPALRGDEAPPSIDARTVLGHTPAEGDRPTAFTASSADESAQWRVIIERLPGQSSTVLVGTSLRETVSTITRLEWVAVGSTVAALVALAIVAFWVDRLGIRPIEEITTTADAIAAGDLSRRVREGPPSTEAGRLSRAMNTMLHQIEWAFARRDESEAGLRQFVADASHELRTPLTSIRGYADLYAQGALTTTDQLDDAMGRISSEGARMGALVDDLLLLAHLDEGRSWIADEPVDVSGLAADAVADARAVEPDRPISLDVPDVPAIVRGDEPRLRQLVSNLVSNARIHTPPDTPVTVRVSADERTVRLDVADEGPGLDPDLLAHVFERFVRGDPARARGHGGTGLGLSIVAAVAQAHGGRATVETASGQGACFTVELPAAPGASGSDPS